MLRHLTRLFARPQAALDFVLGQRADPDQHLAQAHVVFGQLADQAQVVGDARFHLEPRPILACCHRFPFPVGD